MSFYDSVKAIEQAQAKEEKAAAAGTSSASIAYTKNILQQRATDAQIAKEADRVARAKSQITSYSPLVSAMRSLQSYNKINDQPIKIPFQEAQAQKITLNNGLPSNKPFVAKANSDFIKSLPTDQKEYGGNGSVLSDAFARLQTVLKQNQILNQINTKAKSFMFDLGEQTGANSVAKAASKGLESIIKPINDNGENTHPDTSQEYANYIRPRNANQQGNYTPTKSDKLAGYIGGVAGLLIATKFIPNFSSFTKNAVSDALYGAAQSLLNSYGDNDDKKEAAIKAMKSAALMVGGDAAFTGIGRFVSALRKGTIESKLASKVTSAPEATLYDSAVSDAANKVQNPKSTRNAEDFINSVAQRFNKPVNEVRADFENESQKASLKLSQNAASRVGGEAEGVAKSVSGSAASAESASVSNPVEAVYHATDGDIPVKVTGVAGERGGVKYYNVEGSKASLPETKLTIEPMEEAASTADATSPALGAQKLTKTGDLINKYGAMEPGENPTGDNRMVYMPAKTGDDMAVRRFARTAAESKNISDEMAGTIEHDVASGHFSYKIASNKSAQQAADRVFSDKGFTGAMSQWKSLVNSNKRLSKNDIALGERLLVEAGKRRDSDTVSKLVSDIALQGTNAGQVSQAMSMLKRMTPQGTLYYVKRFVEKENADLITKYGAKAPKISISDELTKEILGAKTQQQVEDAEKKIIVNIAQQLPPSWADKFDAWRYLSMLGNPKTHIRNILGNVAMDLMRRTKNVFGVIPEKLISKENRTKAILTPADSALKQFAKQDYKKIESGLLNTSKLDIDHLISQNRRVFSIKPLEWVRKVSNGALDKEDAFFIQKSYTDSLAQVLKARGLSPKFLESGTAEARTALDSARQYAMDESLKATFHDSNSIASAINFIENRSTGSKTADVLKKVAIGGLVPFKKTPMNIIKRGAAYSPVGLLKTLSSDVVGLSRGKIDAAKFIDNLSEGLSGTSIAALGGWLMSMGLITTSASGNTKTSNYEKQVFGSQDYSIKLGDKTYTLNWMTPTSMPFFLGAEIYNQIAGKSQNVQQGISRFADAMTQVSDPVFNLSMLQGINDAIQEAAYSAQNKSGNAIGAILTDTGENYLSQFVPTLLGQIARSTVQNQKSVTAQKNGVLPNGLASFVSQTQAKIPYLNQKLPDKLNVWGQPISYGSAAQRVVSNFVSPGYLEGSKATGVDREIDRIYKSTGDSSVIPNSSPSGGKVTNSGTSYYLNPKELARYQQVKGQTAYNNVLALMSGGDSRLLVKDPYIGNHYETINYSDMTDAQKASAISKIYRKAAETAKADFLARRGIS